MPQSEEDKLFEAKVLEILQKSVEIKLLRRFAILDDKEFIELTLFIGKKPVSTSLVNITDLTN